MRISDLHLWGLQSTDRELVKEIRLEFHCLGPTMSSGLVTGICNGSQSVSGYAFRSSLQQCLPLRALITGIPEFSRPVASESEDQRGFLDQAEPPSYASQTYVKSNLRD